MPLAAKSRIKQSRAFALHMKCNIRLIVVACWIAHNARQDPGVDSATCSPSCTEAVSDPLTEANIPCCLELMGSSICSYKCVTKSPHHLWRTGDGNSYYEFNIRDSHVVHFDNSAYARISVQPSHSRLCAALMTDLSNQSASQHVPYIYIP